MLQLNKYSYYVTIGTYHAQFRPQYGDHGHEQTTDNKRLYRNYLLDQFIKIVISLQQNVPTYIRIFFLHVFSPLLIFIEANFDNRDFFFNEIVKEIKIFAPIELTQT